MTCCILTVLLSAAGVLVPATASVAAARSSSGELRIEHLSRSFSPNGDGDRDLARLRYRLPNDSRVSIAVFASATERVVRVALHRQSAGSHVWSWDGRIPGGKVLPDGFYRVEVRTPYGHVDAWTELDLRFRAAVWLEDTFGRPARETQAVYPRSTAVRDSVHFIASAVYADETYRREVLLVKDAGGSVVMRRDLVKNPTTYFGDGGDLEFDPAVWEARDDRGRPLPRGQYTARVTGEDEVGNTGASKLLPLWVSSERLEWVEETRAVVPADAALHACEWSPALGACDHYTWSCGQVVPSARFGGGMSHRAGVCAGEAWQTQQVAEMDYFVPVSEAVRGVDAARVAFSGAPTVDGESDLGRLRYYDQGVWEEVASSTVGQSGWFEPWIGRGQERRVDQPRVPAGAVWSLRTTGTDAFDVASFVVDLRYLAVAD